jgi:electron transport complex protein RnfG
MLVIRAPHDLPGPDDVVIYRLFAEEKPVAALIAVTARDGYAGPIRVLVGIEYDGTVTGIRILEHRETPGLGDRIVSTRSDWVFQFDGHSLGNPDVTGWALKRDGGQFDQLTGASVTPRAVISAVKETLIYFDVHRDEIFAAPVTEEPE